MQPRAAEGHGEQLPAAYGGFVQRGARVGALRQRLSAPAKSARSCTQLPEVADRYASAAFLQLQAAGCLLYTSPSPRD
eukprot:4502436-Alexandrium_andersonii.AAC.1